MNQPTSWYIFHPNCESKHSLARVAILITSLLALCSCIPLLAADLPAGTQTTLYSFAGGNDGATPAGALIWDTAGNLYGTTMAGGAANKGTIFKLSPGPQGWTESVLYSFTGANDGASPASALTFDALGNLYGTTQAGGIAGAGVVFKLTPSQGGWAQSVLFSFGGGTSGWQPAAGVVLDSAGNIYGTTAKGGFFGGGIVFELVYSYGVWREQILHSFGAGIDGSDPESGITIDRFGNIYGTTYAGGVNGKGAIYLLRNDHGNFIEYVIYNFTGGNDGANPHSGVTIAAGGRLLGATYAGGSTGSGVLYQMLPVSALGWKQAVIHDFAGLAGGSDGDRPMGDLVLDASGNLYGIASKDGTGGGGTIFKVHPTGVLAWQFSLLYGFNGGSDGLEPRGAPCLDAEGHLYGTTASGGAHGYGAFYEIAP